MELLKHCRLRDRTAGAGKRFHYETIRTENEWARALIPKSE